MKRNAVKRLSFAMSMVAVVFAMSACVCTSVDSVVVKMDADSTVCHWRKGTKMVECFEYQGGQAVKKDTTGVGEG